MLVSASSMLDAPRSNRITSGVDALPDLQDGDQGGQLVRTQHRLPDGGRSTACEDAAAPQRLALGQPPRGANQRRVRTLTASRCCDAIFGARSPAKLGEGRGATRPPSVSHAELDVDQSTGSFEW